MDSRYRVLVVERDPAFVHLYTLYLRDKWAWDIAFADSLGAARLLLTTGNYHVCFVRTDPTDTNAFAFCAELKATLPGTVVIAATPVADRSYLDTDMADITFNMQFLPAYMRLLARTIRMHYEGSEPEMKYRFKLHHANDGELEPVLAAVEESLTDAGLAEAYMIEIVDIHQQPDEAEKANVTATPLLIREAPLPRIRFIGDYAVKDSLSRIVHEDNQSTKV